MVWGEDKVRLTLQGDVAARMNWKDPILQRGKLKPPKMAWSAWAHSTAQVQGSQHWHSCLSSTSRVSRTKHVLFRLLFPQKVWLFVSPSILLFNERFSAPWGKQDKWNQSPAKAKDSLVSEAASSPINVKFPFVGNTANLSGVALVSWSCCRKKFGVIGQASSQLSCTSALMQDNLKPLLCA